jgi:hypothetical protein
VLDDFHLQNGIYEDGGIGFFGNASNHVEDYTAVMFGHVYGFAFSDVLTSRDDVPPVVAAVTGQ